MSTPEEQQRELPMPSKSPTLGSGGRSRTMRRLEQTTLAAVVSTCKVVASREVWHGACDEGGRPTFHFSGFQHAPTPACLLR
jgi:hypothetical protein